VDVRLVAATSRDLLQMAAERKFRTDLYYRLNVFPIRLPPLRERSEDIPSLVCHFVDKYAAQMNKQIERVPADVMAFFILYHWPGNIRELQNFIERSVIMSPGKVLCPPLSELEQSNRADPAANNGLPKTTTLAECEREHIVQTLRTTHGVVGGPNGAATILGLKRTTLLYKMDKLGIGRKETP
jgi:formate hydrogenlyase transcriptional activator